MFTIVIVCTRIHTIYAIIHIHVCGLDILYVFQKSHMNGMRTICFSKREKEKRYSSWKCFVCASISYMFSIYTYIAAAVYMSLLLMHSTEIA